MKVLFLTYQVPYPPDRGDRIRPFHQLRALVARGHEVHLLALSERAREWPHRRELKGLCASVTVLPRRCRGARLVPGLFFPALNAGRPLALSVYAALQAGQAVAHHLSRLGPDVVFASASVMAHLVPSAWASRTVVDLTSVNWSSCLRWPLSALLSPRREQEESERLRAFEAQLTRRVACCLVSTEQEAAALGLDEFTRRARLRVIADGVDAELYRSNVAPLRVSASWRARLCDPQAIRLVFVGSMDVAANAEGARYFAEEVFPLVRARVPQSQFLIVGHHAAKLKRLGNRDGVTPVGMVEDVRPYLNAATICVIPTFHSRGIQHKALEAMAAGRAVVTTPAVADGLHARDGHHLLIARDTSEFAAAVEMLIADERLREELAASARAFVTAAYDWAPLLARFTDLIEGVADRAKSNRQGDQSPGNSTLAKLRRRGI